MASTPRGPYGTEEPTAKNIKAQKLQNQISALATQTTANSIQEQIAQLYVQILYSKDALERKQSHGRNGEKPVWTRKGDV